TGAHPHDGLDGTDPHLAVTDLAGACGPNDAVHHLVDDRVVDDNLDPDFGHEVDRVFSTPVDLGVTLLPPVALDFADRHAQDPGVLQGGLDVVEGERLNDRGDQLHLFCLHFFGGRCSLQAVGAVGQAGTGKNRTGRDCEIVTALRVLGFVDARGL